VQRCTGVGPPCVSSLGPFSTQVELQGATGTEARALMSAVCRNRASWRTHSESNTVAMSDSRAQGSQYPESVTLRLSRDRPEMLTQLGTALHPLRGKGVPLETPRAGSGGDKLGPSTGASSERCGDLPTPSVPSTGVDFPVLGQPSGGGSSVSDPLHKADWPYSERTVAPSLGERQKKRKSYVHLAHRDMSKFGHHLEMKNSSPFDRVEKMRSRP